MLPIVLLYALFATSPLISEIILRYYSTPIFLAGSRMLLAGIVLLAGYYCFEGKKITIKQQHLWYFAQIVFFGIYANYILRFWALQSMGAAKTSFLYNASPFFSSLYSYFIFGERVTYKQWLGLTIGLVGLIPILLTTSPFEELIGGFSFLSLPELAALGSVASHAYSWIVIRRLVRDKSYSPIMVNGLTMFVGGILSMGTAYGIGESAPVTQIMPFLGWLTLVILVSNILCHNLYAYLLKQYTATLLSFAGFLSPFFTAFYQWLLWSKTISWHFYLSGIIVFCGLYLFYQEEFMRQVKE